MMMKGQEGKKCLTEDEPRILNGIVSGYFDFAEIQAAKHIPMRMGDYLELLDRVLSSTGGEPLEGAGKASRKQAMEKANRKCQRFLAQSLSPVEESYLQTIREAEKAAKKNIKEKQLYRAAYPVSSAQAATAGARQGASERTIYMEDYCGFRAKSKELSTGQASLEACPPSEPTCFAWRLASLRRRATLRDSSLRCRLAGWARIGGR